MAYNQYWARSAACRPKNFFDVSYWWIVKLRHSFASAVSTVLR